MLWTGLEAFHKMNGRAGKLHEISRFVREGGGWLYVAGVDERFPDTTFRS
jgi:uncharacterized protein YchJ